MALRDIGSQCLTWGGFDAVIQRKRSILMVSVKSLKFQLLKITVIRDPMRMRERSGGGAGQLCFYVLFCQSSPGDKHCEVLLGTKDAFSTAGREIPLGTGSPRVHVR